MINNNTSKPAILLDFKKDRIRIYKRTLHSIGDPAYILLLVNPEGKTIAILQSDRSDLRAYRLPPIRFTDKQSFEITSKLLMKNLLDICSHWENNCLYRIYGEVFQNECMAQFNLSEAVKACGRR